MKDRTYLLIVSEKYQFTWFVLVLTIIADVALIALMLITKFNMLKSGEIIGIIGLSATFVAIGSV